MVANLASAEAVPALKANGNGAGAGTGEVRWRDRLCLCPLCSIIGSLRRRTGPDSPHHSAVEAVQERDSSAKANAGERI